MTERHVKDPDDRAEKDTPQGGSTGERLHERGAGFEPAEREQQRPDHGSRPGNRDEDTGKRRGGDQDERHGNRGGGNQGDR